MVVVHMLSLGLGLTKLGYAGLQTLGWIQAYSHIFILRPAATQGHTVYVLVMRVAKLQVEHSIILKAFAQNWHTSTPFHVILTKASRRVESTVNTVWKYTLLTLVGGNSNTRKE